MAYRPQFELATFDLVAPRTRCKLVLGLVRALVDVNREFLALHPDTPPLYSSGVRYRVQQTVGAQFVGIDLWWDIPVCLGQGEGTCNDLAAWRVAELQLFGVGEERSARPFVHSRENGSESTYHIVVKYPDGHEEDPSVLLGMWPAWQT